MEGDEVWYRRKGCLGRRRGPLWFRSPEIGVGGLLRRVGRVIDVDKQYRDDVAWVK